MTLKTVYTCNQAARVIGISPRTLAAQVEAGMVKCWRVPGSLDRRFNRNELERYLIDMGRLDDLGRLDTEWANDQQLSRPSRTRKRKAQS